MKLEEFLEYKGSPLYIYYIRREIDKRNGKDMTAFCMENLDGWRACIGIETKDVDCYEFKNLMQRFQAAEEEFKKVNK